MSFNISAMAARAREAAHRLAETPTSVKNEALVAMADALEAHAAEVLKENASDLKAGRDKGLSPAMLDRLTLDESRIAGMAGGLRDVSCLADPVGETTSGRRLPNGLEINQVRTPLGVIAMIYEARPNVTVDAAGLCLKSGNAVILRGGSEAVHSNRILAGVLKEASSRAGAPDDSIQMIPTQERVVVDEMLKLNGLIDLVIPRGSERLIRAVAEKSTIPVIKHFKGLCHLYIDRDADAAKATAIAVNAKAQRPGTCNSIETILVHVEASHLVAGLVSALSEAGVEIRGCDRTQALAAVKAATDEDWATEYLELIVSMRIVDSLEDAMAHIRKYSSGLAEAIVTENYGTARRFLRAVDSAAVYANASTRFTDGAEFGLGAEIGITTDRVFPRGPMGLRELTSSKYVIYGDGHTRV